MRKLVFLGAVIGLVGCGGSGGEFFSESEPPTISDASDVQEPPIPDAAEDDGYAEDDDPDADPDADVEIEDWWNPADGPAPVACHLPDGRIEMCVEGAAHLIMWTSPVTNLPAFCRAFQPASSCTKGAYCAVVDGADTIQGTCLGDVGIDD